MACFLKLTVINLEGSGSSWSDSVEGVLYEHKNHLWKSVAAGTHATSGSLVGLRVEERLDRLPRRRHEPGDLRPELL
jgi:hypothetical protein